MTKSLPPKSLVLYADDDQDDVELVKEAFKEYTTSIELLSFSDGAQLLSYLIKIASFEPQPCLIILDINMPLKTGKEVLKELRNMKSFEEVPVVLFSTSTLPSEAAFAKSYNAGFLTKPLHTEQIFQLVDQLIEHCTAETKQNIKWLKEN